MTSSNERMCICCRKKDTKINLIKITRINDSWNIDKDNTLKGRSFYIHKSDLCVVKSSKAVKRLKLSADKEKILVEQIKGIYESS